MLCGLAAMDVRAQVPGAVVLDGTVVEAGRGVALEGVTVELRGVAERITDERGGFRFADLAPGAYTLHVRALGYRLAEVDVAVRADTTLRIELAVDPLVLESIRADARLISLRGRVTDRATERAVHDATVHVGRDREATTNLSGNFRVRRVAEGVPAQVEVRALGYLPVRLMVVPEEGRPVDVALETDPIGLRMIDLQVERLADRMKSIPVSLVTVDREALVRMRALTLGDVVREKIHGRPVRCLIVDEMSFGGGDVRDVLNAYVAEELERVEVLGRGTMVRVYTRRFVGRMIRDKAFLQNIVWGFSGCH